MEENYVSLPNQLLKDMCMEDIKKDNVDIKKTEKKVKEVQEAKETPNKFEEALMELMNKVNKLEESNKELQTKLSEKNDSVEKQADTSNPEGDLLTKVLSSLTQGNKTDSDRLVKIKFLGQNAEGLTTSLITNDNKRYVFRNYGDITTIKLHEFLSLYNKYNKLFVKTPLFTITEDDLDVLENLGYTLDLNTIPKQAEMANLGKLTTEELRSLYNRVNPYFQDLILSTWARNFYEGKEDFRNVEKVSLLNTISGFKIKALYDSLSEKHA